MWDQLGNESRPSNYECVLDVVWTVLHTSVLRYPPYNSNTPTYRALLEYGITIMSDVPEYSLASWYCGGREQLLEKMKAWLIVRNRKIRRKVRGVLKALALLYRIYKDTLERYYLPGNTFEKEASLRWNPLLAGDGYALPLPP